MSVLRISERLRRSVTDTTAFCPSPVYRNPDGPEAADLIEGLYGALEQIIEEAIHREHAVDIASAAMAKARDIPGVAE